MITGKTALTPSLKTGVIEELVIQNPTLFESILITFKNCENLTFKKCKLDFNGIEKVDEESKISSIIFVGSDF